MLLNAVLLFVALATSDVSGRASRQYDLTDCRINHVADKTHHADDPNNCRVFYNCDNANGGKLTTCPEGTIYNADAGLCESGGDCGVWFNRANCLSNPRGVMRFKAQCCHTYFEYECSSRSFKFQYCGLNQYFNPNPSAPNGGSCGPARNPAGCDMCNTVYPDTCDSAGLEAVDPCKFKYKGVVNVIRCAEGTALNMTSCRCIRDDDNVCTSPQNKLVGCQSKRRYNFQHNRMQASEDVNGNPVDFQMNFMSSRRGDKPVYFLEGADLSYTSFAFKLRFSLDSSASGQTAILTGAPGCTGLKLEVRAVNRGPVTVTFSQNGETVGLEGTANNNLGSNEMSLVVIFSLRKSGTPGQFSGNVNGNPMRQTSNNNLILDNWASRGLSALCQPIFNYFSGTVSEFSFWRGCVDLPRLN